MVWLYKGLTIHSEAASALLEDLNMIQENLRQKLRNYNPKDIFNCNETGLF